MCQHKLQLAPNGSGKGEHVVCVECNSKWARVLSRGKENPMPKAANSFVTSSINNNSINSPTVENNLTQLMELPPAVREFLLSCDYPQRMPGESMADYVIRYMEWQRQ